LPEIKDISPTSSPAAMRPTSRRVPPSVEANAPRLPLITQ
jgi:hypothetical protein